jgi:hypothetical protein
MPKIKRESLNQFLTRVEQEGRLAEVEAKRTELLATGTMRSRSMDAAAMIPLITSES